MQTAIAGQVILQFNPGITAATASAAGRRYGLDMVGGPLLSGPLPSGRFVFQIPQAEIEATTPTTARIYFPTSIKPSDRAAYLAQHKLQVIRWIRGMDDVMVAEVQLPATPLNPNLLDPIAGLFQVALPLGLEMGSVSDWAKTLAMKVVSYDPSNGSTVLHPDAWRPILPRPISFARNPYTPPPVPPGTLYAQFTTGVTADTINALAAKLGLSVASIGTTNLVVLSGDPATTKAAIQLLSDNPSVQCVGVSADPCAPTSAPAASTSAATATPTYGQPASVSVAVSNGVLEVQWSAAPGATAYAIFRTPSPGSPYELVAIVAGQDRTSFIAFDQTAPGSSVYYQVVALHPCAQPGDGSTCDLAIVPFAGQGTSAGGWTNPVQQDPVVQTPVVTETPPVQQTAPSPAPTPNVATQPDPAASPAPSDPSAAPATPSPTPPAPPTAAPAPPAPTVVVQPPAQTRLGPGPLGAPVGLSAAAADGHVTLGWQQVAGATAYRVYRSTSGGSAAYVATTSDVAFTDVGGAVGTSYSYQVVAVAGSGLVGKMSDSISTVWQGANNAPVVLRSLPAQVGVLSGNVRLQVDARSSDGRGQVQWNLSGPAANMTIGTAIGGPSATAPLSWSSATAWDTSTVPDGSYTVSAVVTASSGQQTTTSSTYRIQNAAPIAPINLSAVSQAGGVALTWQQAASANSVSYRIYRDQPISGNPLIQLSADLRSFVDAGVQPGRHAYEIVSMDAQGKASQPASAQVTVGATAPAPDSAPDLQVLLPTGQALASGGRVTDRVLLIASPLPGLSFEISRDGRSWSALTQIPRCAQDACTFDLSMETLPSGPYSVRAVSGGSASPVHTFVRVDATRYGAPGALTAQVTGLGVQLSWTAPEAALPASYQVSRRINNGDWKLLDQVASATFIDATAPPGVTSGYRVRAVDPEGSVGLPSSVATVSVPSIELAELQRNGPTSGPANLQVTTAHGRAALRWDPVSGSDAYVVERSLEADGEFAVAGTTTGVSFVDTPSSAAREISYRVLALSGVATGAPSAVATALVIPISPPAPLDQSAPASDRPVAPSTLTATLQAGSVELRWASGTPSSHLGIAPTSTFSVYRLDPATGAFALAASGLESPSFNDVGLPAARFGYVVTAASTRGLESVFSDPAWVTVTPSTQSLSVQFVAPAPADASLIQAESLRALARITAAAGLDQVAFAIAPAGGLWHQLSAVPVDPRAPLPGPSIGSAPAALWGTTLNTTSMAPGSYKLRVQVRDRAGNSQEQVQDLFVAGTAARGPPAFSLNATPIPGGVHLEWTAANTGSFLVQRSLFGQPGPFETIASSQTQQYDDLLAIPGRSYAYQVVVLGAANSTSSVAASSPLAAQTQPVNGAPAVSLGAVSQAELALAVASAASTHPLAAGLQPLGSYFDVNATSLASGEQVHHLGERAQVTFALPPGLSPEAAAAAAIFHWDDASSTWMQETSTVDPSLTSVTATINHLSQFALVSVAPSAGGGPVAQPPAPPTDSSGQSTGPSVQPPSQKPLEVAADGEVVSLRTANSRIYKNANGSLQQKITTQPMNYQDAAGAWQKIDSKLIANSGASGVHNAANSFHVDLPGTITDRPISVDDGSATISMALVGAGSSSLSSGGNHASYAAALPGVDASYDVIPSGLKESLVINHRPPHSAVFAFDIKTGSLVLSQQSDGTVLAIDATGHVRFTIAAPWMYDAAVTESDRGTMSHDVAVTLTGGSGSYRLTYTPDAAWLNDPARRYPVTLDPTFLIYGGGYEYDDQINTYAPNFNYHGYTYLPIGYTYYSSPCCASAPSRAEVQFTNFLNDGWYASAATLSIYQYTNYGTQRGNCCTLIYVTAPTSAWSYGGVTWNNQPGVTGAYSSAYTLANGGWVNWNVLSLVRAWQTHALNNYGMMLYANAEGGPYNNHELFYGGNSGSGPELSVTYDSYQYGQAVGFASRSNPPAVPNGGTTPVEVVLVNSGSATWGTDTKLKYRWWSGGVMKTDYTASVPVYVPYSVPGQTSIVLRFNLVAPNLPSTFTTVQLQFQLSNNTFLFSQLWFGAATSPDCDQYYNPGVPASCTAGAPITLANESATIAWQGSPQVVSAVAGSLISIPLTLTNTSTAAGGNYTWRAYNAADLIRVGIRDYRSTAGSVTPLSNAPNLRTYLSADVAPQASTTVNAVIQAPGEPGDYLLRIDLVHDSPTSTVWFADQGNQPLEVRARIVAAGDDKTTHVPVPLGDGSSLGVNTSNGFAALSATDLTISERAGASLELSRMYNGVNGLLSSTGTSATSSTYGLGWTFNFQRSLHLGSLGPNTYDPSTGTLTDSQGRAWTLTWNFARGLYEDAAGNRTVTPSSAQVVTSTGSLTVPGLSPVDLLNGAGSVVADATAPGGYALRFEGTTVPPTVLVMPSRVVPAQQNGSIEFWFRPNFDMSTDTGCHVFFSDAQMRFGLAWNCPTPPLWGSSVARAIDFFTYDADAATWNVLASAAVTWAPGSWHHLSITWAEGGVKQLMTDTTVYSSAAHAQSPIGDLSFGYEADGNGGALSFLNGRIAQLRIDGRVVPQTELNTDAASGATVSATANTLYLGRYDNGTVQSSAGIYVVRNADQSIETYSPAGILQSQADRFGNFLDYTYDSSGRILNITDRSLNTRKITFTYNGTSFTATDLAGRTLTYQLNAAGDLVSVTRSNQVPDPRTGVFTAQNAATSYTYAAGHLLQQVIDPRGAETTVNYDQSYSQVVMVDNPIGYWRLGETAGPAADASGNAHPSTVPTAVTYGVGGASPSDADTAMGFNGTSSYVSIPYAAALAPTSAITLEVWLKTSSNPGVIAVLLDDENGGFQKGAKLNYDATGHAQFQIDPLFVLTSGVLTLNAWHHVVGTYDGTNARLYVDGNVVAGPTAGPYVVNDGGAITLGAITNGMSNFWNGKLDEAAIYSVALTASRVQAHYVAGRVGLTASPSGYAANVVYDSPLGYWRLGEAAGTRAFDQSGSGNLGTASGGVSPGQSGALANDADMSTNFDGTSGFITTGPVGSLSNWTLEAWINPASNQSQYAAVFSDVYSTVINYTMFFNPAGTTPLGLVAGFYLAGVWHYTTPVTVAQGTWSHVAATYDGTTISVYIDGVLVTSLAFAASPTSNGLGFRIGRRWDTTNYFAGKIDEAAIYPSALSATRIMAHYNSGRATLLGVSQYAGAIAADKPNGYWRLGETGGATSGDLSGFGNAGTYTGVSQGQAGAIANDSDHSVFFNGSSANVRIPASSSLNLAGPMTIEAWIEKTSTTTAPIVEYNSGSAYGTHFWNYPSWDALYVNFTDTAGVSHTVTSPAGQFTTNAWYHVAAVYDGAYGTLYVNGVQVARTSLGSFVPQTSYALYIGQRPIGPSYFTGAIDEVAVYPAALSAARILAHYQAARLAPIPTTGSIVGTYATTVAADSPVGYWRLDEPAGSPAEDRSGSNNPGSYAGGVTLGQVGAIATDPDTAARFDGSTGYVSIPDNAALFGSAKVTVEAWVNATAWVTSGSIANRRTAGNVGGFTLEVANTSGQINFFAYIGTTWYVATSTAVSAGVWHHVVGTYDGASLRIYIDGALSATTAIAGALVNPAGPLMLIGKNAAGTAYFNGLIDDVAVYQYALTSARVAAHFNAAWDLTQRRVATVQDARGTTKASLTYNDDLATTQVINARGLPSYYTFQQYGGRTLSVTDTGNNVTRYEYDGGAAYRLTATVSPTGLRQSQFVNSGGAVGQQGQALMTDVSGQPSSVTQVLMSGAYPDPSVYGTTSTSGSTESWIWDTTLTVQPGVASHRATPGVSGSHHHDVTFTTGVLIPAGAQLTQWVFIEAGGQLPGNLMLQLTASDGPGHRAFWGNFNLQGTTLGTTCPTNCFAGPLPTAGRWAALTVALGPTEAPTPVADLDLAGKTLTGIQFVVVGGTGAVWWGPTTLQLPGPSVTDSSRAVSRYAYNSTNDVVASVDPNGIAAITDVDANGMTRATSTGIAPAPVNLLTDPVNLVDPSAWQWEFAYPGTTAAVAVGTPQHNGVGSIKQSHANAGLPSDVYKDVTGLSPGTYILVSVWVQTSVGSPGIGGASLMVENRLTGAYNVQRRSASVQTAGQWAQLTLPFIVDLAGQVRIHLWQENFAGTTIWADLRVDDVTPAPDVTLQHPVAVYTTSFENTTDTSWTLSANAVVSNDATLAHTGQYAIKSSLTVNNTSSTVSRTLTVSASATYRVTTWARTAVSGGGGGAGGAQLCAQFSGSNCITTATEGQWQQLQVLVTGSGTLTLQLVQQNFQGAVFFDDVNVERVADQTPAPSGSWRGTSWTGSLNTGAAATWSSSWTGGLGGGPSRQVNITAAGLTADIADTLTTQALRSSSTYVLSLWASSTVANTTITFAGQPFDFAATCTLQATPTLCQNTFTYTGGDKAPTSVIIDYGGQGVRTVTISHPLVALASELFDYTAYGQVSRSRDIFGHSTTTTYDTNSLYPTQTLVAAAPSPNVITNDAYNSLGQLILTTRVNGAQSIAEQTWLDSWGRQVGVVKNCFPAVAPPALCTGASGPATNVMTRKVYDLNGNLVDQFEQNPIAGRSTQTHNQYDANNNRVSSQVCVTFTNPCDGSTDTTQNVVTAFAFDVLNNPTDTYTPLPGCTGSCVPLPACTAGPPPTCVPPANPCPTAGCVDAHTVFDIANRVYQQIANYNGAGDASQASVATQFAYDADGRTVDTFTPITSPPSPTGVIQTGQIDEHKVYDALGRAITDIKAYSVPSWMAATTQARTDTTLDPGGREVSVTGPGTGSVQATSRVLATTDYSDLGRPLYVTADAGGMNAVTRTVYDPRGFVHTWTPPTQQLPTTGMQTTTSYDLSGHITSVVKDDGTGELKLTTSTIYDAYGRPTDVIDPRGIDTNTVYDALDRPVTVTKNYCPAGNTNTNCSGSGITSDQNVSTGYVYDLAGNRIEVVNPRGIIEFTAFDGLTRPIVVVEACQTVPTPPSTSCGTQTSDQNVSTSKSYDQSGAMMSSTDAINRMNLYAYDALGRKVSETDNCVSTVGQCDAPATSGQNLVTQWLVDAQGDILQERSPRQCTTAAPCFQGATGLPATDGANLVTGYTYDGLLRLVKVMEDQSTAANHLNLPTLYAYDPSGNKLTETDGRQFTTIYGIDHLGRVTSVQDARTYTVYTNYSPAGEVISTTDARGQSNANTLDHAGRVIGVTYYKADRTTALTQTFGYDPDGNKTSFSDTDVAQTTVTYDHLNRVKTVTAPAPLGTTTYAYFLDGAQNTITDATGKTTFTEDRLGRVSTMLDPLNPIGNGGTTYGYDAAGRLIARGHAIVKVSATQPTVVKAAATSVVTQWQADEPRAAGDLLLASGSSFGGSGLTISSGWTLVAVKTQSATGGTLRVGLWYKIAAGGDAAPTITSSSASAVEGSVSEWKGNAPSAPLQTNSVGTTAATTGKAVTLTMAAAPASIGGLSFATYAEHLTAAATATEAPTSTWTQENVRTASDTMHLGRDFRLNPTTAAADSDTATYTTSGTVNAIAGVVAFFAAAPGVITGAVTTAGYTGADQIASKTEVSGSTTLASWTNVGYDLAQNRTGETLTYYTGNPYLDPQSGTPSGATPSTYQYDTVNQLSQASIPAITAATYGYDSAHNLTSNAGTTQGYNTNESLESVGAATVGSDEDGNQKFDVLGNALSWNSLSQLEQFSTTETYVYDALGRLTKVTNGANVTQFAYRGLTGEVVQELNGAGGVTRSYAWDSTGRQLYVKSGSNVYYEITDLHGDVAALASAGALVGTEHFDPWGTLLSSSGTTTPFGFQGSDGSWTDPTTGFVSMGVRWYYPKVGRFLSSDPAAGTANPRTPMAGLRWTYALDSPLIHSDPSGLRIMYDSGGGNDPGPATDLCDRMSCPGSPYEAPTVYYAPPAPNKPKPPSCDWRCHLSNGWNALGQVTNIRPDAGGVQDNLIALGNHMDSGWKQRYRDTLSSSADWVNGTRGDLTSGDPYRIARGTVGVVIFSSNFVPGAGEGITLARNAGRVGINELVDHSPQIEQAVTKLAPKLITEGENLGRDVLSQASSRVSTSLARRQAVRQAWRDEQAMINRTGAGTRDWTKAEREELLSTGRVKGYQGHHINSVDFSRETGMSELVGNPNNIKFVNPVDHLAEHGGNWQYWTWGDLLNRSL